MSTSPQRSRRSRGSRSVTWQDGDCPAPYLTETALHATLPIYLQYCLTRVCILFLQVDRNGMKSENSEEEEQKKEEW